MIQQGVFLPHPIARGRQFDEGSLSSPNVGYTPKILRKLDILLTNAQVTEKEYKLTGTFLWAIDATSTTSLIEVRFGMDGDFLRVKKGFFIGGVPFEQLYIKWLAQSGEYMYLIYGVDYPSEYVRNM